MYSHTNHSCIPAPFIDELIKENSLEGDMKMQAYFITAPYTAFHLLSNQEETAFFVVLVDNDNAHLLMKGDENTMLQAFRYTMEGNREEIERFETFELRHPALSFEITA
jgi:hypothetical protein|tara:strand:+ start:1407 stop:1733 length:327 start_codon:yes stop_codon:yes gene_type:complete